MSEDEITEEAAELETLEVETRIVDEIDELVLPAGWVESHQRAHAQKVREHLATIGR